MDFWKDKYNQRTLYFVFGILFFAFLLNIFFKAHMYGQRTVFAGESWLSTVSSIYLQNWFTEGIFNLKFAMIRTFDSIEMRHYGDREVYASFLPGCLFLPFIVSKLFSIKPDLYFVEAFASGYHFLGSLLAALISFLLCKRLELSENLTKWFSTFSGLAYIFFYINFRILSFAYYTDTSVFVFYLLFLLTEFSSSTKNRLIFKAILVFLGFFHEWFFIGITLVSIFSEIIREGGKKRIPIILLSHLGPAFLAVGIYVYHLNLVDKLEHSIYRMLRRSFFNPVSATSFDHTFSALWKQLFNNNKTIIISTIILSWWTFMESKLAKINSTYKNLFIVAFGSAILQISVALQHSAEHGFAGLKLLVPLCIFTPFFFYELSKLKFIPETSRVNFIITTLSLVMVANLWVDMHNLATFKEEHPIYKKLEAVFRNYSHEDLFFSYNLEILLDKYPKVDIKTIEGKIRPFDRVEGEPYLYYSARKQVYFIESPEDILKMLDNRDLHKKAKVHLVFYPIICEKLAKDPNLKIYGDGMYILSISQEDIDSKNFEEKFSCDKKLTPRGFYAASY